VWKSFPLGKLKNGMHNETEAIFVVLNENQSTEKRNTTIMLFAVRHIKKIKHKKDLYSVLNL